MKAVHACYRCGGIDTARLDRLTAANQEVAVISRVVTPDGLPTMTAHPACIGITKKPKARQVRRAQPNRPLHYRTRPADA